MPFHYPPSWLGVRGEREFRVDIGGDRTRFYGDSSISRLK